MVEVLMGVYNAQKYIAEQINSILTQTYSDWVLVIQDDCSTDRTVDIVKDYVRRNPGKISYRVNQKNSGSPQRNFFTLLEQSRAPYVMTCDHDDVWKPEKIQVTLDKMQELETQTENVTPTLVHTDLTVVDQELQTKASSMIASQKLNPKATSLAELLVQNNVTGCTMMCNRALVQMVNQLPFEAIMHDWYYSLVAAAFGKIGFVDMPTLLYRQHGENQVGAKTANASYAVQRVSHSYEVRKAIWRTYEQAAAFEKQFGSQLTAQQKEMVHAYAMMPEKNKVSKIRTLSKYHLYKYGTLRKMGQLLYC